MGIANSITYQIDRMWLTHYRKFAIQVPRAAKNEALNLVIKRWFRCTFRACRQIVLPSAKVAPESAFFNVDGTHIGLQLSQTMFFHMRLSQPHRSAQGLAKNPVTRWRESTTTNISHQAFHFEYFRTEEKANHFTDQPTDWSKIFVIVIIPVNNISKYTAIYSTFM